ncbi:MAG: thioredoxin domain-containing protein [Gemmatimonadota bacterium]
MEDSLTLGGSLGRRALSFIAGVGMAIVSILTINHFFAANYPTSIWEGSFCDISAFFNCDSSAFALISAVGGVPLGYLGLIVGALVALGAVFPSEAFERTNKTISLVNAVGVVFLFFYSVLYLKSLCLLCSGFYVFSLFSFALFWTYGIGRTRESFFARWFDPSLKHLAAFAVIVLFGAYGLARYHDAVKLAQSGGVAARVVEQYFSLPTVETPSIISPFWTARSSERFEDAPIRIVEYGDLLCPDCQYLNEQLVKLKEEFKGKMNVAFQFFPLDAECNQVVEKDKHPGACDVSYMAAYDSSKFLQIHDEIFANLQDAKSDPEWRMELARRYGVEAALDDPETKELVQRIIDTGVEYERTSDTYSHGIRSTPTMILNNRMVIGTFPYEQLRAIFQALVDEQEAGERKFMEHWVEE